MSAQRRWPKAPLKARLQAPLQAPLQASWQGSWQVPRRLSRAFVFVALLALSVVMMHMPAVAQTCSVTRTGIAFGQVDTLQGQAVSQTTYVSASCKGNPGATVRVCLNLETPNGRTSAGTRQMLSGANILPYQIYSDAGRTKAFGSWRSGGSGVEILVPLDGSGNGLSAQIPLYALVFGGQMGAMAGAYSEIYTGASAAFDLAYTTSGQLCPNLLGTAQSWGFTVNASVPKMCQLTTGALNFGTRFSLSTPVDATASLSVVCTNGLPFEIALSPGLNATTAAKRKMSGPNGKIAYGLYQDAARLMIWGKAKSNIYGGTGTGAMVHVPVYGRVPAQATPPAGTYTDTVAVTVTY